MRIVHDLGDVSSLLPEGIERLTDAPFTLVDAISRALLVIGWERNLLKDEMPPRRIWMDNEKLKGWFDEVDRQRERRMKGDDSGSSNFDAGERNSLVNSLVVE